MPVQWAANRRSAGYQRSQSTRAIADRAQAKAKVVHSRSQWFFSPIKLIFRTTLHLTMASIRVAGVDDMLSMQAGATLQHEFPSFQPPRHSQRHFIRVLFSTCSLTYVSSVPSPVTWIRQHCNLLCLPENYQLKYYLYHALTWPQVSAFPSMYTSSSL